MSKRESSKARNDGRGLIIHSITVKTCFWATHSVLVPDGSLEPKHNHNFAVTAKVSSEKLNDKNMVMDFLDLKKVLDEGADNLSGKVLDDIDYFKTNGQTAEIIAEYFYEKIEKSLPAEVKLESVTVEESADCCAIFSK